MGMYLNPDNWMFRTMLNSDFYVDKTRLAAFMNKRMNREGRFVCVSRPRRFGKSVDADMLVAYYSRGANSKALFEGLDISQESSFETHLNMHDVVKLDIQRIHDLSLRPIGNITESIANQVLAELRTSWPDVIPERVTSLAEALQLVFIVKGSGFVFVVDEWDFPMRETDDETIQRTYLDFLRGLFKGAPYVEACYMTGILPIKKYGQHSALNLFEEFSMTSPDALASLTGFNADEVCGLCERFGMDMNELDRWYDGYLLGPNRIHVYNPRSVSGAISSLTCRSFWTRTETYEALQRYIDIDFDGVAAELVAMLNGQKIPVDVSGFGNDMRTFTGKDDVYALLVHLGYLGYDEVEQAVFIPNEEIRREFVTSLRRSKARPQLAALVSESRTLQERTLAGDAAYVSEAIGRAHRSAAGPRHYNDEQALRAAVKLAYIWSIDDYLRVDELPGGRGYADVAFIPKPGSPLPPLVVELKWNKPADSALSQIRTRNYPAALQGLAGECLLVGITYDDRTSDHFCEIERVKL